MKHYQYKPSESESLRSINRSKILQLLFKKGSLARNQISEHIGLTAASVTRIVTECIDAQLIIEQKNENSPSGLGRRPIPLSLNPKEYFVVGAHIGTLWLDIGLMNFSGKMISNLRYDRPEDPIDTLKLIKNTIENFKKQQAGVLLAIGVTLYGQVDLKEGKFLGHNVIGWKNVPVQSWLENELHVKTVIDTNIYSMAIAEFNSNPLPPDNALLVLNIGTTIGMGMVVDNVVIRGKQGLAGFLEHMPWSSGGPECECGLQGCLTSLLTDRFLLNQAKQVNSKLDFRNIHDLIHYSKQDRKLRNLLHERAYNAGNLLAKLAALHDPTRIVLSGSCSFGGPQQMEWVQRSYEESLKSKYRNYSKIESPNANQNFPLNLIGAGTIALQKAFSPSLKLVTSHKDSANKSSIAVLPL